MLFLTIIRTSKYTLNCTLNDVKKPFVLIHDPLYFIGYKIGHFTLKARPICWRSYLSIDIT